MTDTYFCIDVEASGPAPALFDLVSVGGVAVRAERSGRHEAVGTTFYAELRPQGGRQDPEATAIHGLTDAHLRAHGIARAEALDRLDAWVEGLLLPRGRAIFVGHNAPFDWSFVNHAYHAEGRANPFGWKALDTKALAMGVLGLAWFDTNKETLREMLPSLGAEDPERVHRADEDARYQARILCALLDHASRRPARPG